VTKKTLKYFVALWMMSSALMAQDIIPMVSVSGEAQGTTYHIKYFDKQNRNLKIQIDSILNDFDKSLSKGGF
jgi:thiamine biosynthesis lipoprotein